MANEQKSSLLLNKEDLEKALRHLNALRHLVVPATDGRALIEQAIDGLFGASEHLIVYGSLAPNGSNHHQLAELRGDWQAGWVYGELWPTGWGAKQGYPALCWRAEGEGQQIPVWLFVSEDLPGHWERLDQFEGHEYRRILAPMYNETGLIAVGNLYAASEE